MIRKRSNLRLDDIHATRKRLGERELSEAKLKLVIAGGDVATNTMDTKNGDTD